MTFGSLMDGMQNGGPIPSQGSETFLSLSDVIDIKVQCITQVFMVMLL